MSNDPTTRSAVDEVAPEQSLSTLAARESGVGRRVATGVVTLVRVVLGILWINEGLLKWHAGFGRVDILLVVESTAQNPRVPDFYKFFTHNALGRVPDLFGFGVPLIEFGLGVALVLGVFTLLAALASVGELCNYWLADQLITQYPIMIALSAVVAVFGPTASRVSVTTLYERLRHRRFRPGVRRWF